MRQSLLESNASHNEALPNQTNLRGDGMLTINADDVPVTSCLAFWLTAEGGCGIIGDEGERKSTASAVS